jgi:hypothetical protein
MNILESPTGQPTIEWFGISIMEPMVTFTDLWITAVCLYAFYQLRKRNLGGPIHHYLRAYFLIMGLATFLGGILGHAFQYALSLQWKLPGWLISMIAVVAIERASIFQAQLLVSKRAGKALEVFNLLELITFLVITFYTLDFFFVKVHSAYGLGLVVLPLHVLMYKHTAHPMNLYFIRTVLFASLSAVFYTLEIGLHVWFNHLDVAHTIMAISMYGFYRGALFLDPKTAYKPLVQPLTNLRILKAIFGLK